MSRSSYLFLITCVLLFSVPLAALAQQNSFNAYTQELPAVTVTFDMVAIPAGKFKMGSRETEKGRKADEGPVHEVKLDAFWISKHEITWDIYELFVSKFADGTENSDALAGKVDAVTRPTPPYLDMTFGMGKEGHPAVGMTQYNAIQFCKWLYSRTGVFYRLPTEAEWEYASRAGTTSSYSFGEEETQLNDYGWYAVNSENKTHPVGSKKPNAWGIFDMHGNVAEWTLDEYIPDYYKRFKGKIAINPIAIPKALYPHAVRGGSFADVPVKLRSASRGLSDPEWKKNDPQIPKSNWWFQQAPFIGVRLVRPQKTPSKEEIEKFYNQKPIADYKN